MVIWTSCFSVLPSLGMRLTEDQGVRGKHCRPVISATPTTLLRCNLAGEETVWMMTRLREAKIASLPRR